LQPGTYYAFDTEGSQGPPEPGTVPRIEVTGETSDAEGGPEHVDKGMISEAKVKPSNGE
jgi:hypothetical protein